MHKIYRRKPPYNSMVWWLSLLDMEEHCIMRFIGNKNAESFQCPLCSYYFAAQLHIAVLSVYFSLIFPNHSLELLKVKWRLARLRSYNYDERDLAKGKLMLKIDLEMLAVYVFNQFSVYARHAQKLPLCFTDSDTIIICECLHSCSDKLMQSCVKCQTAQ